MSLREEGYWDEHYEEELKNFHELGDEGEVWFGLRLTKQIVDWLICRVESDGDTNSQHLGLLDIGCGNALLLCKFAEQSQVRNCFLVSKDFLLAGIDYSQASIELAKGVVQRRNLSDQIQLAQDNILEPTSDKLRKKYAYLVDKGTLDAICLLAGESNDELAKVKMRYMEAIYSVSKKGTIFIIASCNHTEEELMNLFKIECSNRCKTELIDRIETPTIMFGGRQGSQVTCLVVRFTGEMTQ